jgi:hypothetical protein
MPAEEVTAPEDYIGGGEDEGEGPDSTAWSNLQNRLDVVTARKDDAAEGRRPKAKLPEGCVVYNDLKSKFNRAVQFVCPDLSFTTTKSSYSSS